MLEKLSLFCFYTGSFSPLSSCLITNFCIPRNLAISFTNAHNTNIMCLCIDVLKEEEEEEEITPELVTRLVTRPEDLPHNVAANIKKYRDMMLRTLEVKNQVTMNRR